MNNCNYTGTLPAAWAAQLPALREINASSNYLTGAERKLALPPWHPESDSALYSVATILPVVPCQLATSAVSPVKSGMLQSSQQGVTTALC